MNGAVVNFRLPRRALYKRRAAALKGGDGELQWVSAEACEAVVHHGPRVRQRPTIRDADRGFISDPFAYFKPIERAKLPTIDKRNKPRGSAANDGNVEGCNSSSKVDSSRTNAPDDDRKRHKGASRKRSSSDGKKRPLMDGGGVAGSSTARKAESVSCGDARCEPDGGKRAMYVRRKLRPLLTQEMIDADDAYEGSFFREHSFELAPNQPHEIVGMYFEKLVGRHGSKVGVTRVEDVLPHWTICPFGECTQVTLYRGPDHPYTWYPHDLRDEDASKYTVYCSLVSRIDFIEALLGMKKIPHEVRRHLVMIQDAMMYMTLFMDNERRYDDEMILRPATFDKYVFFGEPLTGEDFRYENDSRTEFVTPAKLYANYIALKRCVSEAEQHADLCVDRDDVHLAYGAKLCHVPTYYDVFRPSYELIFHYGELPDIASISQFLGIYTKINKNASPDWDEEFDRFVELCKKAGLESMKLRSMHDTFAKKTHASELVSDCQKRMMFATLGGYYPDFTGRFNEPSTSFYVRRMLYDWLSFRPPGVEFCDWANGHHVTDATGRYQLTATHKKIVLFIVKSHFANKSEVCSVSVVPAGLHDSHLYLQFHFSPLFYK